MNSHETNPSRPWTQPLLLAGLLVAGLAVMWHLSQNLLPQKTTQSELAVATQSAAAPPRETSAPPDDREPADGSAAVKKGDSTDFDSVGKSPAGAQPTAAPVHEAADIAAAEMPDSLKDLESRKRLPRLVSRPEGRFIETGAVIFNSGSSKMREASYSALDSLIAVLRQYPQIQLVISGHTDNLGSESVNKTISAERAGAVMQYLVSQGIDRSRLQSKGMGSSSPIASNDTRVGRQANRRIEFLVARPK